MILDISGGSGGIRTHDPRLMGPMASVLFRVAEYVLRTPYAPLGGFGPTSEGTQAEGQFEGSGSVYCTAWPTVQGSNVTLHHTLGRSWDYLERVKGLHALP